MVEPYTAVAKRTVIHPPPFRSIVWCERLEVRSSLFPDPTGQTLRNIDPELGVGRLAKSGSEQLPPVAGFVSRRQTIPADAKACDGDPASGEFHAG